MGFWDYLFKSDKEVNPLCVEDSAYAAMTYSMQKRLPVRVVISRFSKRPNTDHAQAQAYVGNQWRWLKVTPYSTIVEGDEDAFGEDYGIKEHYKMLTIKELMNELDAKGLLDNVRYKYMIVGTDKEPIK